jgi:hypothetical protein
LMHSEGLSKLEWMDVIVECPDYSAVFQCNYIYIDHLCVS